MKINPAITSFNAGELSPLLGGRPDLEKWQAGLSRCENLIPRVQGALQRRGGSRFVGAVKAENSRAWLAPFVFSQSDAFVLEFGDHYIRFYRGRGRLVTQPSGEIYEIASPWPAADLVRPDGSFGLRCEQSGDVIYIACAGHRPRKLSRRANTDWLLEGFEPQGGPFADQNLKDDLTVTVTDVGAGLDKGASVRVNATAAIFQPGHVGGLFRIEMKDGAGIKAWQVRVKAAVGDLRRSDEKYYLCTAVGPFVSSDRPQITGEEKPTHTKGRYWDGTGEDQEGDGNIGAIGVEWEYQHAGYGWLRITAVADGQTATGEVLSRLPAELVSNPTQRWAHGAWSDAAGWPDNVCFFRERLTFVRGQSIWHSVAGDYENFEGKSFGETLPDSAVSVSIQSAQGNPVEWITATGPRLFLGTNGGEHSLASQTGQQAYGPGNTQQNPESAWGGVGVDAVQVGAGVIFVEKLGRRLRLVTAGDGGLETVDLNKYHGLLPAAAVSMVWQQTPHEALWCACADGSLRALTLQFEDKVVAWHRHVLGGEGAVECLAAIPAPDGGRDDVWMIVRRTIGGQVRRYVEYLGAEYEAGDDAALAVYADSALVYAGAPTTTLSGLEHLEGLTVSVKIDGAAHPRRLVTDGAIILQRPAGKAVVGLPAAYRGRLMPLEGGAAAGTSQAKTKRIHKLNVRLLDSLGGRFGPSFGATDPIEYRTAGAPMDAAPPLFTGDAAVSFPGGYDPAATIAFEGADEFPFTLIALWPELVTYEG